MIADFPADRRIVACLTPYKLVFYDEFLYLARSEAAPALISVKTHSSRYVVEASSCTHHTG